MLSGSAMERWKDIVTEGNSYASKLECSLSKGSCSGVPKRSGQADGYGHKTTQAAWVNQVNNTWERLLYQTGVDWKISLLPDEARALLVNAEDVGKKLLEGKWISFEGFAEDWKM